MLLNPVSRKTGEDQSAILGPPRRASGAMLLSQSLPAFCCSLMAGAAIAMEFPSPVDRIHGILAEIRHHHTDPAA